MAERDEARKEAEQDPAPEQETEASEQAAGTDAEEAAPEAEKDLETRLAEAEAKAAEHWDRLLRAGAEMENMRKRSEREVANAHRFALERFVAELLPVVDSLELALKEEGSDGIREGVEMTLKQLLQTLEKFGVERLRPEGETFDPQIHEAMTAVPSPDAEPDSVLEVVQTGYVLNGRVVRPARVVVAKAPDEG